MAEENRTELDACLHGSGAPCSCACPFSLDIRAFLEKLKRGSFNAAFSTLRSAVVFPEIVRRICPAPCKTPCAEALDLPALEQAAAAYTRASEPPNYNLPEKTQKIAVVGASLAGVTCALKLSALHYPVTVYEQTAHICQELECYLPREIFEPEIKKQFKYASCEFQMHTQISDLYALQADVICVPDGAFVQMDALQIFSLARGLTPIAAILDGCRMADELEWFLKTGNRKPTGACKAAPEAVAWQADKALLSKPEARQKADTCTGCDCSACMTQCVLLRQYGAPPQDLAKEVGLSLNIFPETQGRAAMRVIGACNNCGLCKNICPKQIDIGAYLLHARAELCAKGILPPAHHEFWLRDMAFSNSPAASAFYLPHGKVCRYLFFPGCQAGGSDARYVSMTYEKLLAQEPDTGILLRCCGVPALWAGEAELFQQNLEQIRQVWNGAGCPTILAGCPSCMRTFSEYLPEIPVQSIYELLPPVVFERKPFSVAAVFDPCSSRGLPAVQKAVRKLIRQGGIALEELDGGKEAAQCCSWGGQAGVVNPLFVKELSGEQAARSDLPYITYCTNCRDIFSARGKQCRHMLDLLNGINPGQRLPPTATQRRDNRRQLKRQLCQKYGLTAPEKENCTMLQLQLEDQVSQKISEELILEEDLKEVIGRCEQERHYLISQESGHRIAHLQLGYMTYWVEYSQSGNDSFTIYNAYSHRMTIKTEYAPAAQEKGAKSL